MMATIVRFIRRGRLRPANVLVSIERDLPLNFMGGDRDFSVKVRSWLATPPVSVVRMPSVRSSVVRGWYVACGLSTRPTVQLFMASYTESDQVFFTIIAALTAKFLVVNLQA